MSFWRRVSSLNLAKTSLQWPPLHNGHFLMPPRCIPKFKDPIEWLGPVKTLNLMRQKGLKRRLFSYGCVFLWKSNFRIQKRILVFFLGKSKNGSWIHKIHPQGGFYGSNPNPDFWDSQSERIARLFLNPYLSCFFPTNWKNNSSASVLNSYNFTILRSVFYSRNICLIHFVHSFVAYVAFSSCLRRENQFVIVIFFHEEHEDMPLSR